MAITSVHDISLSLRLNICNFVGRITFLKLDGVDLDETNFSLPMLLSLGVDGLNIVNYNQVWSLSILQEFTYKIDEHFAIALLVSLLTCIFMCISKYIYIYIYIYINTYIYIINK